MRPIFSLAFTTGMYVFALGMIIPILPFQILELGGTPFQATLIYAVFSGVSVLTLRFWGLMSDRFGRVGVLWLSVSVTALSYIWLARADALWEVYASRALAGAFAAWLPVSQAYVSDVIRPEKRAAAMGLLGVGFGVGFTIGPAVGGYLASSTGDFVAPFTAAGGVCLVTLLLSIALVRNPTVQYQAAKSDSVPHSIWRDKALLFVLGLYFGVSVLFTGIEGVLAVWGEAVLDWQPSDVGYLLMTAGLGSILAQGFLIRVSTRKFRESGTILIGLVGLAVCMIGLSFACTTLSVTAALFGIAVFMGLHNPAIQSMISQLAPEELRGKVLGIAQAAASLARVIGPFWAALAFQQFGGSSVFMIAAGGMVVMCLFGWGILRPYIVKFI